MQLETLIPSDRNKIESWVKYLEDVEDELCSSSHPSNIFAAALTAVHEGKKLGEIEEGNTRHPGYAAEQAAKVVYSTENYPLLLEAAKLLHPSAQEVE